jgi:hypothetical protein
MSRTPFRLLGIAGLIAATLAGTAGASSPVLSGPTTLLDETVASGVAVDRECQSHPLLVGDGYTSRILSAPAFGGVRATLQGSGGDWDLAVFDAADGRYLGGSSGFGTGELVTTRLDAGQRVVVQACRIAGGGSTARLRVQFWALDRSAFPRAAGRMQMVDVETPTRADRSRLIGLGFDLTEHGDPGHLGVVLHGPADADRLRDAGFRWTVKVDDLVASDARHRAEDAAFAARVGGRSALPSGRTGYRLYADMGTDLKKLVATYPDLVKPLTLPLKSVEGRPVEGVEITSHVNERDGKPVFLQMGVHHAREWPSVEIPFEWMFDIVQSYGKDPKVTDLLDHARVIFVPLVNPDGFVSSREDPAGEGEGGGGTASGAVGTFAYRRKTCRLDAGNPSLPTQTQPPGLCDVAPGVDPNRNYGGFWGGAGAGAAPADQTYRGGGPFSEPESENIRRLVSTRQVATLITNHTVAGLVLRPPGVKAQGPSPDEGIYKALGDAMAKNNGYTSQFSYQLYDTSGTTEDWSYYATGGLGFTYEMNNSSGEFHPAYEDAVVAQYYGKGRLAGRGNREAYFTALRHTVDITKHSILAGRAPAGVVLRLKKSFKTLTSDVCIVVALTQPCNGPTIGRMEIDDNLNTTMVVPKDATGTFGAYEWHINPSTRPISKTPEVWTLTCEDDKGTVLEKRDIFVVRGQRVDLDLGCGQAIPPLPDRGGSSTPGPTPPATRPGTKPPTFVKLKLNFSRFGGSARLRSRQKVLRIRLRSAGLISNLQATLRYKNGNGAVYGTGSLKKINGRAVLSLRVRRTLRKGFYSLVVIGRDSRGRRGKAGARLRFT